MKRTLADVRRAAHLCCFAAITAAALPAVSPAQAGLVLDPALDLDLLDAATVHLSDVLPLGDGDLVVAGQFLFVAGVERRYLVRLNADGSPDLAFLPVDVDGPISNLAAGPGGTIYVGGYFARIGATACPGLARLHADGSLDPTFVAAPPGAPDWIMGMRATSDGGLYVAGSVSDGMGGGTVRVDRYAATGQLAGGFAPIVREQAFLHHAAFGPGDTVVIVSTRNGANTFNEVVRRYRADGTRDPDFQPPAALEFSPRVTHVNADNSVIVGGNWFSPWGPGLVRLRSDGSRDESYGGSGPSSVVLVSGIAAQPDGSIVVCAGGMQDNLPPALVRFTAAGLHDPGFEFQGRATPDGTSLQVRTLAGGGLAVFGDFSAIGDAPIAHLARLNENGVVQAGVATRFTSGGNVERLVPYAGGTMLVGGAFTQAGEAMRGGIVRLGTDDAIDPAFPQVGGTVRDIAIDAQGRAVVAGAFPSVPGTTSAGIFRVSGNTVDLSLLAGQSSGILDYGAVAVMGDGSLVVTADSIYAPYLVQGIRRILPEGGVDPAFQLNTLDTAMGPNSAVGDVAADATNRLLLTGGDYLGNMRIQGVERPGIARTSVGGLLDASFAPTVGVADGRHLRVLPDGRVLVIGRRTDAGENSFPRLHRFHADGSLDGTFQLDVPGTEYVLAYTLTPDNALLVSTVDTDDGTGTVRRHTPSGQVDGSFAVSVGRSGSVSALAFDAQGRLWLGGHFDEVDGQRRISLARFAPPALFVAIDGPSQVVVPAGGSHQLTTTVSGAAGTVTYQWLRNGAPVAGAVGSTLQVDSFDASKAGEYTVTATSGGASDTSGAVRLVLPVAPSIVQAPSGVVASLGGAVVLRVMATGLPAPAYQWFRNGVAIDGATGSELRLRGVTADDAGDYTVRVTNLAGSVTSGPARVAVVPVGIDPSFAPPAVAVQASTHVAIGAGRSDGSLVVSVNRIQSLNGGLREGLFRLGSGGEIEADYGFTDRFIWGVLHVTSDGTAYVMESVMTPTSSGGRIIRVNASGGIDPAFAPAFTATYEVKRVVPLPDGRVVVAGGFSQVNGVPTAGIVRLLANGAIDPGFNPGPIGPVIHAAVAPDGTCAILVQSGGQLQLRRLLASGAGDPSFMAPTIAAQGGGERIEVLADGSYLVLGSFASVNGVARANCARILTNGALADNFTSRPGSGAVQAHAIQPDGSLRIVSIEGSYYDNTCRIVTLDAVGAVTLNRTHPITGISNSLTPAAVIQPGGGVVLAGAFTHVGSRRVPGFARFDADGGIDTAFQARIGTYQHVHSAHALAGGRWAVAGQFTELAGVSRPGVGVIGPDGRVDAEWEPGIPDGSVVTRTYRLAGDRIIVRGYFPPFGGQAEEGLRVLGADGSRAPADEAAFPAGSAIVAVSPRGHVFLARQVPNAPIHPLVDVTRLTLELAADPTFEPVRVQGGLSFEAMSDGRLFIYTENGLVTDVAGVTRTGLCRITATGRADPGFNAPLLSNPYNVLPREAPGGKLIIAGGFNTVNGVPRVAIARLNDDGSLDTTFTPPASGLPHLASISTYAVEPDGRVMVFGRYRSASILSPNDWVLTRLNADGSWDPGIDHVIDTFNGTGVEVLASRENGDVLAAGAFLDLGGERNLSIARITANRFQASAVRGQVAIPEGGTGFLEVRLTGPVSLPRYAWTRNGQPVPDGDRSVLALRDFSGADVGPYRVEVTGADGATVPSEIIDVVLATGTTVTAQTPLEFSATGGLGGVRVDAPPGTTWSVTGMPSWIETTPAPAATGSRTVGFTLAPNHTGAERSAAISIAGLDFTVRQRATSSRLVNISTRGRVGAGDDTMVVGFVTSGAQSMDFLGRGVGPTLANFGVGSVLPDPVMYLKRGPETIEDNDEWDGGANRDEIVSESRRVGAFDLVPGAGDAALLVTLTPGIYTAVVFDVADRSGVALAEFYDRTAPAAMEPQTRLANISTRGRVGTGDDALIAGFVISGPVPKQVLIRAVGPGLGASGIGDHLVDPFITLVRQGAVVAGNDDWAYAPEGAIVATAMQTTGAFALESTSRDAALMATLEPGSYTALVTGADGGSGVAIVEVYDLE